MIYKDIIKELETKIPKDNGQTASVFRRIKSYASSNHISYWHLVHLKALCHMYEVDGMGDFKAPDEISGVKVFYAMSFSEVQAIIGSDKARGHYNNCNDEKDESFFRWIKSDYKRLYDEDPEYAVVYTNDVYFISKARFRIAEERLNAEKQAQTESEIE